MSLQKKENNLRKAQARFDKVSKRSKQFQIEFVREQSSRGKFKTKANIVRGEKQFRGNSRGILHKAANLKYRVKGDAPSVTRLINSYEPTTKKGKLLKKTAQVGNFAVHDVKQTAVDTALAAETVGLKASDIARREVGNKLKQKYTRETVKSKHDSYKKRRKKPKSKSGKKAKKTIANAAKEAVKFVKNVCEKEVIKFFATIAIPILIIFLVFAFITMIFSSTSSDGSFLLGTYAAQDYDLSEAEKYYTELAYNFNQKILKVSDSENWKDGLADFGANKNDLKDTPNNWYWGKFPVYD